MAFVFGVFMFKEEIVLFDTASQQWMGFLQISMSVIFIVIYFSILSLQQIIDLKRQAKNIRILHYMGKSQAQIKTMIKAQVLAMLLLPTAVCFALLAIGTPLINYKMNLLFSVVGHNLLLKAVGGFMLCFGVLCLCYFFIVYTTIKRYIEHKLMA